MAMVEHLRISGVDRDYNLPNVVIVYTNKNVTNGELREIHELLSSHFNLNGITDNVIEFPTVTRETGDEHGS